VILGVYAGPVASYNLSKEDTLTILKKMQKIILQ
jgi:hypothetical protein